MVSSEIVDYVKEQLRAGYTPEEIRTALLTQGWSEGEVNESFDLAGPAPVSPPVKIKGGKSKGFLLSLIGGLLIFIFGLETVLSLPLLSSSLSSAGLIISLWGLFEGGLQTSVNRGTVILIFSIVVILGSFLKNREGKARMGGVLVMIFSVLSLLGFNGFLLFVGALVGIAGGIVALKTG